MTKSMPVVFFGHGNPMHAVRRNSWTEAWSAIGSSIPRPRAVLAVSAHWYTRETAVTSMEAPRTIHDFGGFPDELFHVRYPAPGDPSLAARIRELLAPVAVGSDHAWGLDHGTWSVLCHVFPRADVPIVQLSIDRTKPPRFHYDLAKKLGPLRDEGVLVVGSGNVVHNLGTYAWGDETVAPFDWARRFEARVKEWVRSGDDRALVDLEAMGEDGRLSIPTPDHYLPLLYILALRGPGETAVFPTEGIEGGSISMLSVQLG